MVVYTHTHTHTVNALCMHFYAFRVGISSGKKKGDVNKNHLSVLVRISWCAKRRGRHRRPYTSEPGIIVIIYYYYNDNTYV